MLHQLKSLEQLENLERCLVPNMVKDEEIITKYLAQEVPLSYDPDTLKVYTESNIYIADLTTV